MTDDKKKVVLLPCPHCGGRAALSTYKKLIGTACKHLVIRQHVVCKVCGAQTRVFKALDRAPRAWNKRQTTQSNALKVAREALEGMVKYAGMRESWQDDNPQYVEAVYDAIDVIDAAMHGQST